MTCMLNEAPGPVEAPQVELENNCGIKGLGTKKCYQLAKKLYQKTSKMN